MSRVPFWLVIVFAFILCAAAGVTLLHRSGLLGQQAVTAGPLVPGAELALRAVEKRNSGQVVIRGRAETNIALTLTQNGQPIAKASADAKGGFTLPAAVDLKAPAALTLQAAGKAPLPLLLLDRKPGLLAFYQQDGTLWPLTLPENNGVMSAGAADPSRLTLVGRAPAHATVYLYSNNTLVAQTVAGRDAPHPALFVLTLKTPAVPAAADAAAKPNLRVDILNEAGLPVARSAVDVNDRAAWQPVRDETGRDSRYVFRSFESQTRNPAELLPGQIIPAPVAPAGDRPAEQAERAD